MYACKAVGQNHGFSQQQVCLTALLSVKVNLLSLRLAPSCHRAGDRPRHRWSLMTQLENQMVEECYVLVTDIYSTFWVAIIQCTTRLNTTVCRTMCDMVPIMTYGWSVSWSTSSCPSSATDEQAPHPASNVPKCHTPQNQAHLDIVYKNHQVICPISTINWLVLNPTTKSLIAVIWYQPIISHFASYLSYCLVTPPW